jgi:hypothetical protein
MLPWRDQVKLCFCPLTWWPNYILFLQNALYSLYFETLNDGCSQFLSNFNIIRHRHVLVVLSPINSSYYFNISSTEWIIVLILCLLPIFLSQAVQYWLKIKELIFSSCFSTRLCSLLSSIIWCVWKSAVLCFLFSICVQFELCQLIMAERNKYFSKSPSPITENQKEFAITFKVFKGMSLFYCIEIIFLCVLSWCMSDIPSSPHKMQASGQFHVSVYVPLEMVTLVPIKKWCLGPRNGLNNAEKKMFSHSCRNTN